MRFISATNSVASPSLKFEIPCTNTITWVGNIDFTPYYYWVEGGKPKHKKAKHHEPGVGSVPADAILLRRTNLNDNDAGGRVQYANFAKSTQMLEKLRHLNAGTYRKVDGA